MNKAFNLLIAKRALGIATAEDFSDWAQCLLSQGCESANVAILAGFAVEHCPDSDEIEDYFAKCITELGLVLPEQRVAIFEYVINLATNICDGTLEPKAGLELLGRVPDCDEPLYRIWGELLEDIYTLGDYGGYPWNTGLSKDNTGEFIIQVARQFLQFSEINLPEDFFSLCVCSECGYIGKAQLIRLDLPWLSEQLYRFVFRKSPVFKWVCGQCANQNIRNMFDYEGRKLYLELNNKEW